MTRLGSQGKEFPMMNLNETAARHGFCVDRVRESEELHGKMVEMHHEKPVHSWFGWITAR